MAPHVNASGPLRWRNLWPSIVAVAVLSAPLFAWFTRHPNTYADTFGTWVLHPAHIRSPRPWWLAVKHPNVWTQFTGTYWNFFSPTHLLLSDTAAAWTGVFLLPIGVLPHRCLRRLRLRDDEPRQRLLTKVALPGVLCLPLSGALFLGREPIDRDLAIVPLVALLAANGAKWLWTSGPNRVACGVLLAAAVVQFAFWYAGTMYPIQRSIDRCAASADAGTMVDLLMLP